MGNPYRAIERGEPGTVGWRVHYFEELGSTQDYAAELAGAGAEQGTVVIAESQRAGRGRLGRRWYSPAGANLYATVILRPGLAPASAGWLSLMAGVAAAEAVETVAPGIVALKWPNDVWLRGRKAGGIIAQAVTGSGQRLAYVLLGVGLNLNLTLEQIPQDLRATATSVRIETGAVCDRVAMAAALFSRLDSRYTEIETAGFGSIRPVWERYAALTGKRVTVVGSGAPQSGVVRGIDEEGALVLEGNGGEVVHIRAGEVSIAGAYN